MTAAQLEQAGVALFGIGVWKHPMAEALGINLRNFRHMADGTQPIPPTMWQDVRRLLIAHSLVCRDIAVEIGEIARPLRQVIRHKDGDYRNNEISNLTIETLDPTAGEGEV